VAHAARFLSLELAENHHPRKKNRPGGLQVQKAKLCPTGADLRRFLLACRWSHVHHYLGVSGNPTYHSDQCPLACSQTLAWGWAVNASPRPNM
jgi:hypothetical protein